MTISIAEYQHLIFEPTLIFGSSAILLFCYSAKEGTIVQLYIIYIYIQLHYGTFLGRIAE